MSIIIGGSASTGSSLLAQLLNRNSQVVCGPETYLFTKDDLFKNWEEEKSKIVSNRLISSAWHIFRGTYLKDSFFGWNQNELADLIQDSVSLQDFVERYFEEVVYLHRKKIWAEKTPSNTRHFSSLLDHFPGAKTIHTVRNPFDAISSMIGRGFNAYYATALYLMNTSFGLKSQFSSRAYTLSYENLVTAPEMQLKKLCDFLAIPFEIQMLEPDPSRTKLRGWKQAEEGIVTETSLARFESEPTEIREGILRACSCVRITDAYAKEHQLVHQDVADICNTLGYNYLGSGNLSADVNLKLDKITDQVKRKLKGHPFSFSNYPIELLS